MRHISCRAFTRGRAPRAARFPAGRGEEGPACAQRRAWMGRAAVFRARFRPARPPQGSFLHGRILSLGSGRVFRFSEGAPGRCALRPLRKGVFFAAFFPPQGRGTSEGKVRARRLHRPAWFCFVSPGRGLRGPRAEGAGKKARLARRRSASGRMRGAFFLCRAAAYHCRAGGVPRYASFMRRLPVPRGHEVRGFSRARAERRR